MTRVPRLRQGISTVGWFAAAFAIIAVVVLLGFVPDATWLDALGLAARFGVVGGVAGGAFAGVLSLRASDDARASS